MYQSFEEMLIWQKSSELFGKIVILAINFPESEDYSLTSQIRSSSNCILGNIAKAFGRMTPMDKKNFSIFAVASAFETKS